MADNVTEKEVTVSHILGQFQLEDKDFSNRRWRFCVTGASLSEIRDTLAKGLAKHLDPERPSCLSYIGRDGVFTIFVKDGQVICS